MTSPVTSDQRSLSDETGDQAEARLSRNETCCASMKPGLASGLDVVAMRLDRSLVAMAGGYFVLGHDSDQGR